MSLRDTVVSRLGEPRLRVFHVAVSLRDTVDSRLGEPRRRGLLTILTIRPACRVSSFAPAHVINSSGNCAYSSDGG